MAPRRTIQTSQLELGLGQRPANTMEQNPWYQTGTSRTVFENGQNVTERHSIQSNNVLLFGHPRSGKSMMLICATGLRISMLFGVIQDLILQTYQRWSSK